MLEENVSITNEDIAIVSLKASIANLNLQINHLTSRISEFSDAARNNVRIRNRLSAMHALQSKKMAEQLLARKLGNLSQLEGAYDRIEQAVDQVALIAAMKTTTQVLNGLHLEIGDIENVENVMEELQAERAKSDDISTAMKEVGHEANAVDDEAIDSELELLIHHAKLNNDDKQIQEIARKLDSIGPLGKMSPGIKVQQSRNTLQLQDPLM